jgi:hypothetical protein
MSNEGLAREFWKENLGLGSAEIGQLHTFLSVHIQIEFRMMILMEIASAVYS